MNHHESARPKSKEYMRPMPATWWMHNRYLVVFMLRELSAVFIGAYAVLLMVLLYKANRGPEEFRRFVDVWMESPPWIVLHLLILVFALIHSITFFNLTPKVVIVRQGEERVPDAMIAGAHYAMWAVVSVVVIALVLWVF